MPMCSPLLLRSRVIGVIETATTPLWMTVLSLLRTLRCDPFLVAAIEVFVLGMGRDR